MLHRFALAATSALALFAGAAAPALAGDAQVALIEIEGSIPDRNPGTDLFSAGDEHGLRQYIQALHKAADDADLEGVVIRLKDASIKGSQIEELGQAMKALRAKGKKVHVFAENYDSPDLRLGSFADEVIVQSGGAVTLPGIHMDEMFLADAFKWVGITPDFVQIGDYKGASEMMANAKPSKAWDQNINQLLDSMYAILREQLKAGRKLDDAKLDKAMEVAWLADEHDAIKAGLIDAAVDLPDLEQHLAKGYSVDEIEWVDDLLPAHKSELDTANPFALLSMLTKAPDHSPKRDTIAVVHIDGAIIDGDSAGGGLFGGDSSVGSRTIRKALSTIEDNDKIKGVVLRIDSPGGSAIASEVIWQGVKRIAKHKPVWVSVGSMAASGGYYIAVSGDKIYVNPSSIVGSIGVVGGKLALGGLLGELHVNVVSRSRGPRADMMSIASPWSDENRALVRSKMQQTYDLFTQRVSAGRTGIELGKTAEGRLFTGENAVALKMADKVGSLDDCVNDLAAQVNLSSGAYDVMDYPPPKSFMETLQEAFGGMGASAPRVGGLDSAIRQLGSVAQQIVGPDHWRTVSTHLSALAQLQREPVLLVSPTVILAK